MPDGGHACTEDTLKDLVDVVGVPARALPGRLAELLSGFVRHEGLIILAADAGGGHPRGVGVFVERVSFLALDEVRRTQHPDTIRVGQLDAGGEAIPVLLALSRNGALLVLATGQEPVDPADVGAATVLQLWNIVALRAQEIADAATPDYLSLARASAGERMEALTELADEYSTTLESVLAALRSTSLDDRSARRTATGIAAEGLVQLRTAADRVRTVTEEPVATAFERLRDDLRPLMRYREIDVQFVEPPVNGRPLPSEVAQGARAVVRGSILALIDRPQVGRVRVQWNCDGTNLLIDMRDDGPGDLSDASSQLQLIRHRVRALDGRLSVQATPGWGTEISIVLPLDPPHGGAAASEWGLRPREAEVLAHLATGQRNRAIAAELAISENTVKFHVAKIYRKLGVNSRAEATALFLE